MNLRKDNNGAALNAWKKLGPALIEKPLRHIRNRTFSRIRNSERVHKSVYLKARLHAKLGNGDAVQRIARSMP